MKVSPREIGGAEKEREGMVESEALVVIFFLASFRRSFPFLFSNIPLKSKTSSGVMCC